MPTEFTGFFAGCLLTTVVIAMAIKRYRPRWPLRKAVLVSAAPGPLAAGLLSVFVFVNASIASEESCGVDACAMAMGAAIYVMAYAVVAFIFAVLTAFIVSNLVSR